MTSQPARADIRPEVQQLRLVDLPAPAVPKLTARQQAAYDAIVDAGYEGLHTDELGAIVHAFTGKHSDEDRCAWCGKAGLEVGNALRSRHELVRQRRRRDDRGEALTVWTVAGKLPAPKDRPSGMTDEIPF